MPGEFADDIRAAITEVSARADVGGALNGDLTLDRGTDDRSGGREIVERTAPADDRPDRRTTEDERRDASGRFAPRTPPRDNQNEEHSSDRRQPSRRPAEDDGSPENGVPANRSKPGLEQAPAQTRPPVSWTPEAREEWISKPPSPAIQAEIHRREREITDTLRLSSDARRFLQEMNQIVGPYMPMIQAERTTPQDTIKVLLEKASQLRVGTARDRAILVADLIYHHGVDVTLLDDVLSYRSKNGGIHASGAGGGSGATSDIDAAISRHLAPVMSFIEGQRNREGETQQQELTRLQEESVVFMNDPKNEFAWGLKEDIADILDMNAKRGVKMSLQDAYGRAILLHPRISAIVQSRKQTQNGQQETEAARRARNASASVSDDGAPGRVDDKSGESDSIRSALAASIREVSSRTR